MSENDPEPWSHPDANEDGFVSFETVRRDARRLDLGAFLAAYPRPALRTRDQDAGGGAGGRLLEPLDRGVQLLTERIEGVDFLRYVGRVAFLAKRPGNPYQHLISIGRSHTNDLTVAVESVSKVHGYFVHEDGHWRFTDHGSTNGSRVGERRLQKGEKEPLEDETTVRLGHDIAFTYLLPVSLYRAARRDD